ncbi:DUF1294 domain-containing protein [Colwellia sp. MB02u-14]|uniref:DUF1294 domain-containing protein n=1 Tax=Colwellia sp. MB02u-14 TaxID=2759815 RepID=UPI002174ECE9|nr:DUF1294 domain-containing protein [Colwellia sp. MB02u-14]
MKGKLINWNDDKAFGFIAPNSGGDHVFIHKTALSNRNRTPQINDVITFSISKDKLGRYCADEATFTGEKLKKKQAKKVSMFSIYLSIIFLSLITVAHFLGHIPQNLILAYFGGSVLTYIAYAFDKSKAQRGDWRTQESTLHLFALIGGWPGAAIAQQVLRHKSQKREFRLGFWFTVIVNIGALMWLMSSRGEQLLVIFK